MSGNLEITTKEIKSIKTEMFDLKKSNRIDFTEYVLKEKLRSARKKTNTLMNESGKYINVSWILNMFIIN